MILTLQLTPSEQAMLLNALNTVGVSGFAEMQAFLSLVTKIQQARPDADDTPKQ